MKNSTNKQRCRSFVILFRRVVTDLTVLIVDIDRDRRLLRLPKFFILVRKPFVLLLQETDFRFQGSKLRFFHLLMLAVDFFPGGNELLLRFRGRVVWKQ